MNKVSLGTRLSRKIISFFWISHIRYLLWLPCKPRNAQNKIKGNNIAGNHAILLHCNNIFQLLLLDSHKI